MSDSPERIDPELIRQSSFVSEEEKIGGLTLRPFTMRSLVFCKNVGNQLIMGKPVEEMINPEFEVMGFLFIHSAPYDKVKKACKSKDAFWDAVTDFSESISINDFYKAATQISSMIQLASASIHSVVESPTQEPEMGN